MSSRNLPSAKRLEEHFPGKGTEIRELLERKRKVDEYDSVNAWIRRSYHKPSYEERLMCAINQILEGHGVEAIVGSRPEWPDMEYVNMGDAYAVTFICDHLTNTYKIDSWGGWVEKAERRGKRYA